MVNPVRRAVLRLGGFCGVLSPVIALSCIGISILMTPWFSWTGNWLSDLAGPDNAGTAAAQVFDSGLVLAGALGIVLGWTLRNCGLFEKPPGHAGALLMVADMCLLAAIGIFPETTGTAHWMASAGFFALLPFVQLFCGMSLRSSGEKKNGNLLLILSMVSFASLALYFVDRPWGGNAVMEIIPAVSLALFSMALGVLMLERARTDGGGAGAEKVGEKKRLGETDGQ